MPPLRLTFELLSTTAGEKKPIFVGNQAYFQSLIETATGSQPDHRVVQESTNTYGGGLKLFRIDVVTINDYSETEVGCLTLDLIPPYNEGLHTLSLVHGSSIAFIEPNRLP